MHCLEEAFFVTHRMSLCIALSSTFFFFLFSFFSKCIPARRFSFISAFRRFSHIGGLLTCDNTGKHHCRGRHGRRVDLFRASFGAIFLFSFFPSAYQAFTCTCTREFGKGGGRHKKSSFLL